MTPTLLISITEPSQVGHARRTVSSMAQQLGFDDELTGKAALIATELGNNLSQHARDGELILRVLEHEDTSGVELLAIDRGPGMDDVDRALADGFSTGGTAGKGLGAIRRIAHLFDVHSVAGKGTVVVAQLWARSPRERPARAFDLGVVSVPKPGEQVCGDGWACSMHGARGRFLVVDGLGHGLPASTASKAAATTFLAQRSWDPVQQMTGVHEALRSTRGAAGAVADLDAGADTVRFCGVGNIAATAFVAARTQRMVSHNGTLGHVVSKVSEFQYGWGEGAILVMHSDGLGTSWKLEPYAGLMVRHPAVIAGTLYRDFTRGRDDVTVLVVRDRRGTY